MVANPIRLLRYLARTLVPDYRARDDDITRQTVSRAARPGQVDDKWAQRILELSDGRTVGEIGAIMYAEELRAGAWIVDIGLWGELLQLSIIDSITDLSDRGLLHLGPPSTGRGSSPFVSTNKRRVGGR